MKKHILIVSQCFYPEQFRINDMAEEWVKRDYKVTVLTGIPNYPQGKFYSGYGFFKKRKENHNGVEIIRIPIIPRGHSKIGLILNYFSFVISGFFWKSLTSVKADAVFTFQVSPATQALVGVWYARRRKIPHYMYVQDLWPESVTVAAGINNKAIIGPIRKMVDKLYKRSHMILATSPSFVTEIQSRLETDKEKVVFFPQYAEEFYIPSDKKSDLIPQDGVFNVTFTGNIGTAQGLEILPEAARLLKDEGISVRFNIVGDGRNRENFIASIKKCGVDEMFNLTGMVPATEVPSILASSDVAFLSFSPSPLYMMTIPAKLQSYMACACPIVASASGETKRVIDEAGCGLCSEVGDVRALADNIKALMNSDLEKMGKASRAYFEANFDKKDLMDKMDIYFGEREKQ